MAYVRDILKLAFKILQGQMKEHKEKRFHFAEQIPIKYIFHLQKKKEY